LHVLIPPPMWAPFFSPPIAPFAVPSFFSFTGAARYVISLGVAALVSVNSDFRRILRERRGPPSLFFDIPPLITGVSKKTAFSPVRPWCPRWQRMPFWPTSHMLISAGFFFFFSDYFVLSFSLPIRDSVFLCCLLEITCSRLHIDTNSPHTAERSLPCTSRLLLLRKVEPPAS